MSSDFSTVLVKDARLSGITDQLAYAVQSGASSNTYQEFGVIGTASNSQLAFNIQVPSENVIVSREVFIRATIQFTVAITPGGIYAADTSTQTAVTPNSGGPGGFAFNAFPLNQLFTTTTAQINNTNVSANNQDILPLLLQLADQHDLYTYDDTTAVCVDRVVSKYSDVPANSSIHPLGNMFGADPDGVKRGRGISQLKVMNVTRFNTAPAVNASSGTVNTFAYSGTDNSLNMFYLNCEAELIEPLIGLSPFTYGNNQFNKAGLVGINSFNLVCNIDGQISRLIGTSAASCVVTPGWDNRANNGSGSSTTALFTKASLLVNFLSSQPTDLIPARNIVPYVDLPRYITSNLGGIGKAAYASTGGSQRISKVTKDFESTNIQINQLPDYFIIAARVNPTFSEFYPTGNAMKNAPSFLAINSISVNLNNTSGLLSSATSSDLYRMSVANHSNQTFSAWSGVYSTSQGTGFAYAGAGTFPGVNTTTSTYAVPTLTKEYPSVGSVLVLNPAKDLSLPDYLSSGSLGSFNFQFRLNCSNFHITSATDVPVELIVVAVNSGIFTTIAGSSNIFTGLLTKSMVLDAKKEGAESPINAVQYERLAGGAMMPNSSAKEMGVVKDYMAMKKGSGVRSGGAMSGGKDRFSHLTL